MGLSPVADQVGTNGAMQRAGCDYACPNGAIRTCNTMVAAGAQVTASPAAGGSSTQAVADSSGRYNLRLMPGQYYLWGVTTRPVPFRGQRRLVPVSANTTLHVDVDGALYAA